MPSVRSAALGFFVATGSRGEAVAEAGLSHFLEHLLFRGTDRYASAEIDQLFDGMGAELNAGTDKESTAVYARMLDQHLPAAFDVMADMVWRPAFKDVDPEREVVLEEIAMYEDDPQDTVFDVLGEAVFGGHPLGRPIIGRAPVIRDTPVDVIADFHARRYVPGSVVIAAAGSRRPRRDRRARQRTTARRATALEPAPAPEPAPVAPGRQRALRAQGHRAGARHARRPRPASAATTAASPPACWTRSSAACPRSRLFQAVREERGLAYSVYSFAGQYADTGQVGLYVGTRPDNLVEAMKVVGDELERLREEPATEAELVRARENVKARVVLGMESTGARMHRLGGSLLFDLPLLETDEVMERIDAVTHGRHALAGRRAVGARAGCPRPASAPTRTRSAPPSKASRAGDRSPHDQGRRRRRRRAHGGDDLRGRRGRGGHGADGPRRPVARHVARGRAGRRRRARGLHDPRPGGRQRDAGRRTRACTSSSAPPAGTTPSCARRSPARPARSSPPPNFAIGAVLMMRFAAEASKHHGRRRDHRVPPPGQARRAVRHRRPHRRS